MGFAPFIGAALGLTVQLFSNASRKLPLTWHPWEHVLFMGIGSYVAVKAVEFEEDQIALKEKLLKKHSEREAKKRAAQEALSADN